MAHHIHKCIQADLTFADLCMTILMTAQSIYTVVKMNSLQSGKADHPVKLIKNTIQIMDNVITAIPYMTGIQADTQFIIFFHPVNDITKLLKRCSYF